MDLDPVFLSRIQFAFLISFHIIFPSFTIGLAAWLATIEGARLVTGNALYRRVFDFWLKVFAVSFGMGVVTGIVMAFQFGTNWGVLAQKTGSIQGPLLGYEAFTAFMLEATFFGVMLLGRDRVSPRFYFFACCMVSLGTMFSSFWILANNSWMQVPLGHTIVDGKIIPADWSEIVLGPVMMVRWPHMLLAAFLTTGMCVAATGAWYVLRGIHRAEARVMLHWGLGLVAVLIPMQLFFGHLTGLYVLKHQPAKFAAIEARWKTQQPASEVLIAIPDEANERNLFAIEIPKLGSMIASGNWTAKEIGLEAFPKEDRPPVVIPFFGFRMMVGMGLIMLAVSWFGNFLRWRGRLETTRWFLWGTFLAFPTGFVAVLCGWFTAEVGRQPWVVYGLLRTKDAVTPSLTTGDVLFSLACYVLVYAVVYSFGVYYIYKLLHEGPTATRQGHPWRHGQPADGVRRQRRDGDRRQATHRGVSAMEPSNLALFWAGVIACSILIYVILDGFDLGVGVLFGTTRDEAHRVRMMDTIAPFWDGNETWLVVIGAGLFAAFPEVYAVFLGAFYLPVLLLLLGLIFRGIAFEFRFRSERMRWLWDWGFFLGSTVVAFVQGAAVGAMIRGIPVVDGQYAGSPFGWLHPFAMLTGIGLVLGYALLGAGWLVLKSEGELRDWAYARIRWLAARRPGRPVPGVRGHVRLQRARAQQFAREILGSRVPRDRRARAGRRRRSGRGRQRDGLPFAMTVLFFLAAFLTLGVMFWPYMIPYSITVARAAAPDASLRFLFYGGVVVLPVIAAYTIGVYWVFRGKVRRGYS